MWHFFQFDFHFSPYSAMQMSNTISSAMKNSLVDYIKSTPYPVGLICDGSTTQSNIHLFAILFQVIDKNNSPTCHFYTVSLFLISRYVPTWMKLVSIKNWLPNFQFVELHKFADAKTITNTVIEELKKSTLYPALQQKLLSFTSDGKNWCRKMRLAQYFDTSLQFLSKFSETFPIHSLDFLLIVKFFASLISYALWLVVD